ncbi:hydroxycinnamoyl transferase, partial [Genlisea aurea]
MESHPFIACTRGQIYAVPPPKLKSPAAGVPPELKYSEFKLIRKQLNALKNKCVKQEDGNEKGKKKMSYSTFEVLSGHAWRCLAKSRDLPDDQLSTLYIAVDGRRRLIPPLPMGYFGNAVFMTATTASYRDLKSRPLTDVVAKINASLSRMDDEYLRSAVDYLELNSDVDRYEGRGSRFNSPDCGIVSWWQIPVYDTDFGWGPPAYVSGGGRQAEGKIVFLPAPEKDGSC